MIRPTSASARPNSRQLPLDMLKIDRSFVPDLLTNPNDAVTSVTCKS